MDTSQLRDERWRWWWRSAMKFKRNEDEDEDEDELGFQRGGWDKWEKGVNKKGDGWVGRVK